MGEAVAGGTLTSSPGSYYTSEVFQPSVGGLNAADFALTGPTYCSMSMGQSCVFQVTFTPSATGVRQAKLLANGGPAYTRLLGTGDPAGPSFTFTLPSGTYPQNEAAMNASGVATVTNTYNVVNNGTTTLNLGYQIGGASAANYSVSGNCSAVAPAHTCTVQITFSSLTVGVFAATVTVRDQNSTYSQVEPQSTTAYYATVALQPSVLVFSAQTVGTTSAAQSFVIENGNLGGGLGHAITVSAAASGSFTLPGGSSWPANTQTCTLSVAFRPQAQGPVSDSVTVTDTVSGNTAVLSLSGTGGSPAVSLSTNTLAFPARTNGTTSVPMNVSVTNSGTVPLVVSSVGIQGAVNGNFSQTNNCSTVAAGGTCTIAVTFAPTAPGAQSATVQIVSNAATSPDTVGLTGTTQ